ncbi:MAG: hypothetical protein ACRDUX_03125 [Mycobacterium sp.]
MTALDDVIKKKAERSVEQQAAVDWSGWPKLLTKTVLESASSHQKTQLPDGCSTNPCLLSASMQATNPPSPTAHVPFFPTNFLPAARGIVRAGAHAVADRSNAYGASPAFRTAGQPLPVTEAGKPSISPLQTMDFSVPWSSTQLI